MNHFVLPGAAAALVLLSVAGGSALPVQQSVPVTVPADERGRVSLVCPSFTLPGASTAIAAAGEEVATAPLTQPQRSTPLPAGGKLADQPEPLVVTGPRTAVLGATLRVADPDGDDRGLSLVGCERPRSSLWFSGVLSSATEQAELVLINADAAEAAVDVTVLGAEGRLSAPGSRGLVVQPHSRRVVPLGPLVRSDQQLSLHVGTSAGRVAAFVRLQQTRDDEPVGADLLAPAADPATRIVIPGIRGGKGWRDLVVTNPGERIASVRLDVLGSGGPTAIPGFETLDLPPQTTRVVPLASALTGAPVGLRLTSEQPVTAGVLGGTGTDPATADLVLHCSAGPIAAETVVPLALPASARVQLALTNAGAADAAATVTVTDAKGGVVLTRQVTVPGSANSVIDLPGTPDPVIRVRTDDGELHAAVSVQQKVGAVEGVAAMPLRAAQPAGEAPVIVQDPRVGS